MEITLYTGRDGLAALRSEWDALLHRSPTDTLFLTWTWQSRWWDCIGAGRGPLYILALRTAGALIAIIPLYLTEEPEGRTLQVVGCLEVSDYLDLIVEAGQEPPVYEAFLDWLAGPDAPAWDRLDLCNQPERSRAHALLPALARQRGWAATVQQEDVCPVVALPAGFDAYLDGLDKKQRHEIRRKLRRIEREAPDYRVRYVTAASPELDAAMAEFIRLHRLSSPAKDAFMNADMAGFFHEIAFTTAQQGWLRLAFLEIAGQSVASYFCFTYGSELLVYNSGYDAEAYPQLSPGWVLLARLIEDTIAAGCTRLDFLQGNEEYKYRFGGVDTIVYRTLIER